MLLVSFALCDLAKEGYALEPKGSEEKTNPFNGLENFSNVEVTCDEFFRLIFDLEGIKLGDDENLR